MKVNKKIARFETPILLMVFNRPETTKQVFDEIRKARPLRLYVAADGPRISCDSDIEKIKKVREIATNIDWPCQLKTLFRDENLGCKYGPQSAISWFFDFEDRGIILEDDCLPHTDFFRFAGWCLEEFRDNPKIWHICGNNFSADKKYFGGGSVAFSSLAQVWGWATWADRWKAAEKNVFYLAEDAAKKSSSWQLSAVAKYLKLSHLEALKKGLDAWDYQWQVAILNKGGFVVVPSANLISNLGDGPDATHTAFDKARTRLPVSTIGKVICTNVFLNSALTKWYEKKMGLTRKLAAGKVITKRFGVSLKRRLKEFLASLFFSGIKPITIASTGRSGSTMLSNAIAESLVRSRYPWMPLKIQAFLARICFCYIERLSQLERTNFCICKTHDLFSDSYKDSANYVFIFGDPLESAQSVEMMKKKYGDVWVEQHIYHLCGTGQPSEIWIKDVLNYEAQIQSWGNADGVFKVHYDDLWSKVGQLSDFLGFKISLPKWHSRACKTIPQNYNKQLFDHLKKLEVALIERI